MSAYAALISLKNTLYHIFYSCRLSLVPPSVEIIQAVYEELQPWETILERLDETSQSRSRKKVNVLDGRIKDILWNFEDLLESLVSHQITFQSAEAEIERVVLMFFSIDLQSLQDDVHSFFHTLKSMEKQYIYEVDNMPEDEDEDEDEPCISSSTSAAGYGDTKSKMIGLSDQFEQLKRILHLMKFQGNINGFGLVGMAGVGKTRLAREIYEDPQIMTYFDFRLWITVGRKSSPRLNQDLRIILAELKGDAKCLIVLDDVWQTQELPSLLTSIVEMKNRIIRILLTARNQNVIRYVRETIPDILPNVVPFLNDEESKHLLCLKVFGENIICPHQLDKAATKIANKCEGLPLTIVTVADFLSNSQNRDPKYWEDVAEERNSVFTDAYTQMSKVLFPSYDYLPQRFKMPFLYMAVFPRDYEIPPSKIINMLTAEGWFLDPDKQGSPEDYIMNCLEQLCMSLNLVLFKRKSSVWYFSDGVFRIIKTCRLHSAWRQLCRGEARKNKFYHVLNRLLDASEETIKGQRCLCLENNLLFGITEFCNSVRCSNCASTTRSLLFFGPYQQYPTPIDAIGFKLLRELNALQLRFYTFPTEILTLVQLKYLALACNGDLPPTISKLFNLKVLIIHPHMSITKCCDTDPSSSYIPIEIWDMKELEHIEILGKSFLPPPNDHDDKVAASLEKVSTVVGVNAASICNISKRTPHIRKLGAQMEVMPCDDVDHSSDIILSCFPHISILEGLKTLKCSIINPVLLKYRNVSPSCSLMLPRGLRKLHLSGMGFPWEYMDAIGSLPCLLLLKLRSYAFQGSKWEIQRHSFERLEYLVIEDSDLVEWKPASGSFLELTHLSFKHCFKLQELQWPSDCVMRKIELVNCNPLGVTCAKKLQSEGIQSLLVTASDDFEA